jgi:DNA-binding CsgD family transcriptional regulator
VIDQNIVTQDEMRWDPYYNECVRAMGFEWFAAIAFHAGDNLWALSIQRGPREGPFDECDKKLLAPLAQRLTEVASLSTMVGRVALSAAVSALNVVHQPTIAMDRLGYVLDANPAAEAIFDNYLRIQSRRLFISDPSAASALERLIAQMRATSDAAKLCCDPIVACSEGGPLTVIRVLPVHGAARTPFLGARALLTFSPINKIATLDPNLLAKTFGLTLAESKLAVLAAKGKSPEQIAEQFGISVVTARNQLKAVFSKTGTHRQAELVALLSRL